MIFEVYNCIPKIFKKEHVQQSRETMNLPTGKVSPYELKELLFEELDLKDEEVLVKPEVGADASVIKLDDGALVLSSDPITGSLKNPGRLSVHVNANDVASMGADPKWFLLTLFMPEDADRSDIKQVMEEARKACEELGISLVGGHTEITPGLERVLISGAMAGMVSKEKWVTSSGAQPGDDIIFTKSPAVEGTFILSEDKESELKENYGEEFVDRCKSYGDKLSVVKEALTAVENGEVHAMHDPTEGGLIGGLYELADASEVGFSIYSDKINISEETKTVCEHFGLDPLRTISSGSLLIVAPSDESEKIVKSIEDQGIEASIIGEIVKEENRREIDGEEAEYPERDELWDVF